MAIEATVSDQERRKQLMDAAALANDSVNDGKFKIKVQKSVPGTATGEMCADFIGATLAHVLEPEKWMMEAFGGGTFFVTVALASNPYAPIGGESHMVRLPGTVRTSRNSYEMWLDPHVTQQEGWAGPRELAWPMPKPLKVPPIIAAAPSSGAIAGQPASTQAHAPTATPVVAHDSATLTMMQQAQNAQRDAERREAEWRARMAEAETRAEYAKKEAKLEAERIAADSRARVADERAARLESKLEDLSERIKNPMGQSLATASKLNPVEVGTAIASIMAAISPIFVKLLESRSSRESAEITARAQLEAAKMQSESEKEKARAETAKITADANIKVAEMSAAAHEKVAVANQELIKSQLNREDKTAPMLQTMMQTIGTVMQTSLQTTATAQELLSGAGGDTGWAEVIARGLETATEMFKTVRPAAPVAAPAKRQLQPPKTRALPPRATNPRANPAGGAKAPVQTQPQATQPQPQPKAPPAAATLAQLEQAIHQFVDVKKVAKAFLDSARRDLEVHKLLEAAEMRVEVAFESRFMPWITSDMTQFPKKREYVESLLDAIQEEGVRQGAITPEPENMPEEEEVEEVDEVEPEPEEVHLNGATAPVQTPAAQATVTV